MKIFTVFLILSTALLSCSNSTDFTLLETEKSNHSVITQKDFLNNLKIKIKVEVEVEVEVFNNDKNGYASGENQDHKKWVSDIIDNFEGIWISDSKILGDWAFKYQFSFLNRA